MQRREVERLLRRRRGHRLEAGVAQHDAQRAQDLRLVVDDEHAPARRGGHSARPPAAGAGGELDHERRALPGQGLDRDRPRRSPRRSPRAIASPRPEPRWPALACPRGRTARRRARAAPTGCRARDRRRARPAGPTARARGPRPDARPSGGRRSPAGSRRRARAARRPPARAAGRPGSRREALGRQRQVVDRRLEHLLDRAPLGRGSAASASRRERSSRFSMSRDSRVPRPGCRARARAAPRRDASGAPAAPPAATIAVIGERRSWLDRRAAARS